MSRPRVEAYGITETGGRETNQDQFLIAAIEPRLRVSQCSVPLMSENDVAPAAGALSYLLAVADGMGGQAAGECASRIVIETLARKIVERAAPLPSHRRQERTPVPQLLAVMDECQQALRDHVRQAPHERGLGTTLTLAYVIWPTAFIVHAGDSRAYLVREGRIRRLTTDHTVAQQLMDSSASEREAPRSRWDHVLWNVLGGDGHSLKPETIVLDLRDSDQLLLCTDGLTRGLSDDDLLQVLSSEDALNDRLDQLVKAAANADGRDNITAVAARFAAGLNRHPHSQRRRTRRTETWPVIESLES